MRQILLLLTGLTITAICFSQKRVNWNYSSSSFCKIIITTPSNAELDPNWYKQAQEQFKTSLDFTSLVILV